MRERAHLPLYFDHHAKICMYLHFFGDPMNPTPDDIGLLICQVRKQQGLKQVELASFADVSVRFLHELEHGKASAELGLSLKVLHALGVEVQLTPPSERNAFGSKVAKATV